MPKVRLSHTEKKSLLAVWLVHVARTNLMCIQRPASTQQTRATVPSPFCVQCQVERSFFKKKYKEGKTDLASRFCFPVRSHVSDHSIFTMSRTASCHLLRAAGGGGQQR